MTPRFASTIDELLADGLVQAVMRADRVQPDDLRSLLGDVARRLVRRPTALPVSAGSHFAVPRLEWRRDSDADNASAVPLPAAIANACGVGLCC